MIWAIYRIHYGTDFIIESVNSIIDNVDKIYIFYSEEPWVKTDKINYKNQLIEFPENPENLKKFLLKKKNKNTTFIFFAILLHGGKNLKKMQMCQSNHGDLFHQIIKK